MVRFRGVVGPNANQRKVNRQRAAKFDICLQEFNRPQQHSIQEHLPFYVTPTTTCLVCGTRELTNNFLTRHISCVHPTNLSGATFQRREEQYVQPMNGLFIELADKLGVSFPKGLLDKMNEVMTRRTQAPPKDFLPCEKPLVDSFTKYFNLKATSTYQIPPSPDMDLICFLHWKILKNIIFEPDTDDKQWILQLQERKLWMDVQLALRFTTWFRQSQLQ